MSFLTSLYNRSLLNGNKLGDACDDEWKKEFPSIHEFLTVTVYDGKERQVGKLQITSEDGRFKVSIIDNAEKSMLTAEADTIVMGLTALEHKAGLPSPEWHRWGKSGGTRKRSSTGRGTRVGG